MDLLLTSKFIQQIQNRLISCMKLLLLRLIFFYNSIIINNWHNSPIYDELQTRSVKISAESRAWTCHDDLKNTPQHICEFKVDLPLLWFQGLLRLMMSQNKGNPETLTIIASGVLLDLSLWANFNGMANTYTD